MKKNKLLFIASLTLLLGAVGCGNNPTPTPDPEPEDTFSVSLNESEIKLIVGNSTKLIASNSEDDSTLEVTWASLNDGIATVDDEGYITAISVGQTAVTATIKEHIASCIVNVSADFYSPSLKFENEIKETENVGKNSDLNLSTYISFNGQKFYDMEVRYEVENSDAGSITDGCIFHAGNQDKISTKVDIYATWRSFDTLALHKSITINIISIKAIYINGGETGEFNLFTINQVKEKKYKISEDINSITCVEDGVDRKIKDVEIVDNQSFDDPSKPTAVLVWDGSSGRVIAKARGSAALRVTFTDSSGEIYEKRFSINVNLPVYTITDTIKNFSILDGLCYDTISDTFVSLSNYIPTANKEILKVTQNGKDVEVLEDESHRYRVLGVNTSLPTGFGLAEIVIYTKEVATKITIEVCQKIVTCVDDLIDIMAVNQQKGVKIKGYYILGKDIVGEDLDHPIEISKPSGWTANEFGGVFDGLGHKISVYLKHEAGNEEFGIFGNAISGTIKNVAFDHCKMDGTLAGLVAHHSNSGGAVENIYCNNIINGSTDRAGYGLMYSTYGFLKINDCLFNVPHYDHNPTEYGALAVHKLAVGSNNVFIVSPKDVDIGRNSGIKNYIYQSDADADVEFKQQKEVLNKNGCNALWYPSFQDMRNAGNNYDYLSEKYWDSSKGYPVFVGCDY